MSRIGKQLITIPSGVQVTAKDGVVVVKGGKGQLQTVLPAGVHLNQTDNQIQLSIEDAADHKLNMLWGTMASIVKSMIIGVTTGFSKELELNGVGFKVAMSGNKMTFNLGFTHQIVFELPKGIEAKIEKNKVTISGIDKQLVGQVAAKIRGLRKPEPYQGKGIKYVDEVIRRKAGKSAAGSE